MTAALANTHATTTLRAIGVFDSGVGGWSVVQQIRQILAHEDIIYIADSAFAPYGNKPQAQVYRRCQIISQWFQAQPVKAMVMACNTATAIAAEGLRKEFPFPIVAMEPAIKPATALTRSGVVGILATSHTAGSLRLQSLIDRFGRNITVVTQPCPGLVEQIEKGDVDGPATLQRLHPYLNRLRQRGADVIVLGCTHYPFIREAIQDYLGPAIQIIDSGKAVAKRLHQVLHETGVAHGSEHQAKLHVLTSGDPRQVGAVLEKLTQERLPIRSLGS